MSDLFMTKDFNKKFWIWFDSLSKNERDRFNYYKDDMAKLNFYNTAYCHVESKPTGVQARFAKPLGPEIWFSDRDRCSPPAERIL